MEVVHSVLIRALRRAKRTGDTKWKQDVEGALRALDTLGESVVTTDEEEAVADDDDTDDGFIDDSVPEQISKSSEELEAAETSEEEEDDTFEDVSLSRHKRRLVLSDDQDDE